MSLDYSAKLQYVEEELSAARKTLFVQFCAEQGVTDWHECAMEQLKICMSRFKAKLASEGLAEFEEVELAEKPGEYRIPVGKTPPTDLCGLSNISVRVVNPELIYEGIMVGSYVFFEVKTSPLMWSVRRKFSEFQWLRKMLSFHCPGWFLPPLPHKERKKPEGMVKMATELTLFCETLLHTNIFLHSGFVRSFFAADRAIFEGVVTESWKGKFPETVTEYRTPSGEIRCQAVPEIDHFQVISLYCQNSKAAYKRIAAQFLVVKEAMEKAAVQIMELKKMVDLLGELQDLVSETEKQKKLYRSLSEVFEQWAIHEQEIGSLVLEQGATLFTYKEKEMDEFSDFIRGPELLQNEFIRGEAALLEKKEKLWARGNPSKWELDPANRIDASTLIRDKTLAFPSMFYEETRKLQLLKDKGGYINHQTASECVRVFRILGYLESLHLIDIGQTFDGECQNISGAWRELVKKIAAS